MQLPVLIRSRYVRHSLGALETSSTVATLLTAPNTWYFLTNSRLIPRHTAFGANPHLVAVGDTCFFRANCVSELTWNHVSRSQRVLSRRHRSVCALGALEIAHLLQLFSRRPMHMYFFPNSRLIPCHTAFGVNAHLEAGSVFGARPVCSLEAASVFGARLEYIRSSLGAKSDR